MRFALKNELTTLQVHRVYRGLSSYQVGPTEAMSINIICLICKIFIEHNCWPFKRDELQAVTYSKEVCTLYLQSDNLHT